MLPPLTFTSLILLLTITFTLSSSSSSPPNLNPTKIINGIRVDLIRVDSHGNFTALQCLQRAVKRSKHRLVRLKATTTASRDDAIQTPVHVGTEDFLMKIAIGSPPLPYWTIIDPGSDLIWTQCEPCGECYKQPTPIFHPSNSSSFKKLACSSALCQALLPDVTCDPDCVYAYAYADSSSTQGVLGTETFTLGGTKLPNIGFGCGQVNLGIGFAQGGGFVGLGRGPLSLISQMGLNQFSYCLTPYGDTKTSKLILGASTTDGLHKSFSSTPLIINPAKPTWYYLSLEGITVGNVDLAIPKSFFALHQDGTGGTMIDSGTTLTFFEVSIYRMLKKAFVAQLDLPVADGSSIGLDLCFSWPSSQSNIKIPKLILHFKGADLDLPSENYLTKKYSNGLVCLAMGASNDVSILGNVLQQNFKFVYDLGKETLLFAPAQCDQI